MSKGRLNTVHDFSSLRLHPSGRRVQDQPGGEHKASTKNHHIKSHNTVRDAGGTWIVSDAAGPSTVLKRTDGDGEVQVGLSEEAKGKQRKVPPTSDGQHEDVGNEDEPTPQPRKRRKYTHRNDILPSAFTPDPNFNLPSSDLLKCIHQFASNYYSTLGQLTDTSRHVRAEKRQRKKKEQRKSSKDKESQRNSSKSSDGSEFDGDSDTEEEEEEDGTESKPERRRRNKSAKRRDMYRVMDGSALMAIGMLLQEHVAQLVEPRIPDGWEVAMQKVEFREEKTRLENEAREAELRAAAVEAETREVVGESEESTSEDEERPNEDDTEGSENSEDDEQEEDAVVEEEPEETAPVDMKGGHGPASFPKTNYTVEIGDDEDSEGLEFMDPDAVPSDFSDELEFSD